MSARLKLEATAKYASAIVLAAFAVLLVLPAVLMLAAAFIHDGAISLTNFQHAYSDPGRLIELLKNSLVVAGGSVAISLAIGTPLGFLCFRTDLPCRRLIVLGALLAACVPVYVTATAWMAMTGMTFWLQNTWGAAWMQGLAYSPLVLLVTGVCFAASERDQEEAAMLNTGRAGVCWHVSLPQGSWGIAVAATAVALICLCDITVTDILVIRTFSEEVFTQFQLGAGAGRAAAISLPLTTCAALLGLVVWRICRNRGQSSVFGLDNPAPAMQLGRWRFPFFAFSTAVVIAFFAMPFVFLVKAVGSLQNMFTSFDTAGRELMGTLRTAPLAAALCVLLAFFAAQCFEKYKKARLLLALVLLALVATPGPVVGIGIARLLSRPAVPAWIYNSEAVIVWAYILRTLPFGVLVLVPALRRIPSEINDLTLISGAGWVRKLFSVTVPLCWKAGIAAWIVTFVLSITELGTSFIVAPPGHSTLTLRFFTLIHYGVYPDAAGICLLLLGIISLAAAGLALVVWPTADKLLSGQRA